MTISQFVAMRDDDNARNDFLATLACQSKATIGFIARQMIGRFATADLVANECTQQFMLGANRGIDSASIVDDGRGKNDPEGWCRFKGLNAVRDWLRVEYGTEKRNVTAFNSLRKTIFAEDLYAKLHRGDHVDFVKRNLPHSDPVDYAEAVASAMDVRERLRDLSPVDRSIAELLIFGEDDFGTVRCAGQWNASHRRVAADIALTIGHSESYVFKRLSVIRQTIGAA